MTALLDNALNWDGQSSFPQFGEAGSRLVGQTFLTPDLENTDLRRIRFWLNDDALLGNPAVFKLRVLAWDDGAAQPTGPALFESAPISTTGASGFEEIAVDTGRLTLDPNRRYVAVLVSQDDGLPDTAEIGRNDGYGDGQIVVQPADNGGPWNAGPALSDLAFSMEFSPAQSGGSTPPPGQSSPGQSTGQSMGQSTGQTTVVNQSNQEDQLSVSSDAASAESFGMSEGLTLRGTNRRDRLVGSNLNDRISGRKGNDRIIGRLGADVLSGGAGKDQFIYRNALESGLQADTQDTIIRFRSNDRINLRRIDANILEAGNQAFTWIKGGSFEGVAGQLRFSGGLLEADVNGDSVADMAVAISGIEQLTRLNILL
jgi:Ca2+-binding RTX toxin-like protein